MNPTIPYVDIVHSSHLYLRREEPARYGVLRASPRRPPPLVAHGVSTVERRGGGRVSLTPVDVQGREAVPAVQGGTNCSHIG